MIETRKSEIRYVTSDPKRMLNKYTVDRILRKWEETVVDDKGNKTTIERSQLLFDKGILITGDVLSEIKFWMEEGSIGEIEVSNQNRMGYVPDNTRMYPYKAVISLEKKRHSFLLYAMSMQNAIDILNDYVELNHSGAYVITDLKQLDFCVILVDRFKSVKRHNVELDIAYLNDKISVEDYIDGKIEETEETSSEDRDEDKLTLKFYQIGARIIMRHEDCDDEEYNQIFIVQTFSAVRANLIIEKYLRDMQEERYLESLSNPDNRFIRKEIMSFIEESKIINVGSFIPRMFSEAYQEERL